jgi:dipeptidyl aminopeptidase/acylaminoacyl peptidase
MALGLLASLAACNRQGANAPAPAEIAPPTISRADLFGEPARHGGQLSPRGDRVAFLAPRDGVTNLWVLSVDALDEARAITDDRGRGVRRFAWAADNSTLLYLQDDRGDEHWRLFAVDVAGGAPRALTPAGARAEILALSPADPTGVLVTLNQRDAPFPDVFRYDISTGERALIQRNVNTPVSRGFTRFVADSENRLRVGVKALPDGGADVFVRSLEGAWRSLFTVPAEDALASMPLAVEADGRTFLMLDSTGRDRVNLVRVDMATGAKTVLGESARADVVDVWLDPATNAPEAFAAEYLRREWRALDADAQADLEFLSRQLNGEINVVSRSRDDARWIVVEEGPTIPTRSYLYDRGDRANRRLSLLFRHRPTLETAPLQPMAPVEIEARDGLTLVSYLTLPIGSDENGDGRPETPAPLVIAPHGGPWVRDSYGFNALHQWLANRGYAVMSVNFRGSTGFGRAFLNAGNRQWGARMQEDLLDAMQWAVANGVAQPESVAIVGSGYGGYAALAGLAFTPEQYRCGAAFGAPASLTAMIDNTPPFAAASRDSLHLRVGDPRTGEGRAMLRERSPLARAAQIRRPLLLALGARDPRASRTEMDQIAYATRARRAGLVYLVYPDEGAALVTPQNRLSYLAVLEHFLGDCLGGRTEPAGAAFEGAQLIAYDGAASVPGLSAFARRGAAPQSVASPVSATPSAAPDGESPADTSPETPDGEN